MSAAIRNSPQSHRATERTRRSGLCASVPLWFTFLRAALALLVVLVTLAACTQAAAAPSPGARARAFAAPGSTWHIQGYDRWCGEASCARGPLDRAWARPVAELERVVRAINGRYRWAEDAGDDWRSVALLGLGDCEDFAIAYQDALGRAGWPSGNLRFAAMINDDGDAHVVLLAFTRGAWWTLDQRRDAVLRPAALPYADWHAEPLDGSRFWQPVDVRSL